MSLYQAHTASQASSIEIPIITPIRTWESSRELIREINLWVPDAKAIQSFRVMTGCQAKQLASLDVLAGRRLSLGIGAGYLEPEFRAIGVPLKGRGVRTDEYLAAMKALWTMEQPTI